MKSPKFRLTVEALCFAASVVLGIVAIASPTWIERTLGFSPDDGSGETEWGLAVVFALVALVSAAVGLWELRRYRRALATTS